MVEERCGAKDGWQEGGRGAGCILPQQLSYGKAVVSDARNIFNLRWLQALNLAPHAHPALDLIFSRALAT